MIWQKTSPYQTSWSWAGAQSRLRQLDCKSKFSQRDISLRLSFSLVWNLASHLRLTYNLSLSKTTLDKNNWDQKIFGPNTVTLEKFGEKKILKSKTFWYKILILKKIGFIRFPRCPKSFLSKKCVVKKNFGSKTILGPKSFESKEIWSLKKFWLKKIGSKWNYHLKILLKDF